MKMTLIGDDKNKYDMGYWRNFTQYFGEKWFLFPFPIIPKEGNLNDNLKGLRGEGVYWETNKEYDMSLGLDDILNMDNRGELEM